MFYASGNHYCFPRSEYAILWSHDHVERPLDDLEPHLLRRVRVAWDTRTGIAKPVGLEDLPVALDGCNPVNERRSPW